MCLCSMSDDWIESWNGTAQVWAGEAPLTKKWVNEALLGTCGEYVAGRGRKCAVWKPRLAYWMKS